MTEQERLRKEAPGFGLGVTVDVLSGGPEEPTVVLLHGVHGTANLEETNKYGILARLLHREGLNVAVIETGRLRRDPESFDDRSAWAREAFAGKSYSDDLEDVLYGLEALRQVRRGGPFWLWGFSLGGIHAVMIAGGSARRLLDAQGRQWPLKGALPLDGIALSGSGIRGRGELGGEFFSLPILDSLPPAELLADGARNATLRRALAFYGSLDGTFSEEACRELLETLGAGQKEFHRLEGVDHAFRTVDGEPSQKPLEAMVRRLLPL